RREREPLPPEHGGNRPAVHGPAHGARRDPRSRRGRHTPRARGQGCHVRGRDARHERLPHGVLPGPGRKRADAPSQVRPEVMSTTTRDEAAKRFAELPLPSTADEHWRFTDLRGLVSDTGDPADAIRSAAPPVSDTSAVAPVLDLDVSGRAVVTENGIEILSAPDGVRFEPLPRDTEARLIPDDDKFALENLARWEHGLLVHVPKGVELDKPLYVQVTSNGGSLFWRMVVIAEEGARFTVIEDLSSAADDTVAYTNAVVELFVDQAAKIEYVSLQNLSRETWHF